MGLLTVALRRLDFEQVPQAAVLSAVFFVASLISIPLGPSSAHLLLNGLMGLLLGWTAVPALFIALLLQAVFFGYGGIVVLGSNTLNMVLPALICALFLRPFLARSTVPGWFRVGCAAGLLGVLLTATMVSASLALSGAEFVPVAQVVMLVFVPLAVLEGLITGTVLAFVGRVAPELLSTIRTSHA